MENQFEREKVEKLHKSGEATAEAIEAITGVLVLDQELKGSDADGDFVVIKRTNNKETGNPEIQYIRTSNPNDHDGVDDGTYSFTIPYVVNNEATQTEPSQETQPEAETAVN